MIYRQLIILAFSCLLATAALAEKKAMPMEIPSATTIGAEQLIDLASQKTNLIIVDARITEDRAMGYISESLSLPDIDTDCASLTKIAPNMNQPIAFYCNGVKCGRSLVSAEIANNCGYSDIYWFRGGFQEWQDKHFPFNKL